MEKQEERVVRMKEQGKKEEFDEKRKKTLGKVNVLEISRKGMQLSAVKVKVQIKEDLEA